MLKLVTAPVRPIDLNTVKNYVQVSLTDTTFDSELNRLIDDAAEDVERYTGRALATRTYEYYEDRWKLDQYGILNLPKPPVVADEFKIEYYDEDDVLREWSSSQYQLDVISEPARVITKAGYSWPTLSTRLNAIKITMKCGYGVTEDDMPEAAISAMCIMIASRFMVREDIVIGVQPYEMPKESTAYAKLIDLKLTLLP